MVDPAWVAVGFTVAGVVFTAAIAVDGWVHKQGTDDATLRRHVRELGREMAEIKRMIREANARFSTKTSETTAKIGALEQKVARLMAIDEVAHRHARGDDFPETRIP